MAPDSEEPIERWMAKHRAALILSILNGEPPSAEAAQKHGPAVAETKVRQGTLSTGRQERPAQPVEGEEALKDKQINKLNQKIGELVSHNEILRKAVAAVPFGPKDIHRVRLAVAGIAVSPCSGQSNSFISLSIRD